MPNTEIEEYTWDSIVQDNIEEQELEETELEEEIEEEVEEELEEEIEEPEEIDNPTVTIGPREGIYKYKTTNLGDAEILADYYQDRLFHTTDTSDWYYWFDAQKEYDRTDIPRKARWKLDTKGNQAVYYMGKAMRKRVEIIPNMPNLTEKEATRLFSYYTKAENRKSTVPAVKCAEVLTCFKCEVEDFDTHDFKINVHNGTIDLKTGILGESHSADMISKMANVIYDITATCPRWIEVIDTYMMGDEGKKRYIKQLLGSCLTGSTKSRAFPVMWGDGRNGKSTIFDTIMKILGEYAITLNESYIKMNKQESLERKRETMLTKGKRLCYISETAKETEYDMPTIKKITGDEYSSGRALQKTEITFKNTHKLIIATQNKPLINEQSSGAWDRLHLLDWSYRITDEELIEGLKDDFVHDAFGEHSGILNWLIEGCLDWQENGLVVPQCIRDNVEELKKNSNKFSDFYEECCEVEYDKKDRLKKRNTSDYDFRIKKTSLYATYRTYAAPHPRNKKNFYALLEEDKFLVQKCSDAEYYYGIKQKAQGYVAAQPTNDVEW